MRDPLDLTGRHILLGISGGIACYRSAELVRLLRARGAEVRCVMTRGARQFVTQLTFEALSGHPVDDDQFGSNTDAMNHIRLARWADLLLIAPATAQLLAKLAHGMADDLLSTLALACEVPLLVAPAMNPSMWQAAATVRNVATLRADGVTIAAPDRGAMACGESGAGRMRQPPQLVEDVCRLLAGAPLAGQRWVVTTGPTWEAWDGVRLLTCRASGRLGAEMARVAALMGAEVTLIAGPGTPVVNGVRRVDVESAMMMQKMALKAAAGADCFVSAAAVADYRPAEVVAGKLKRASAGERTESLTLPLLQNPDIVATVAAMKAGRPKQVVAFAAEDLAGGEEAALVEGWRKLAAKGADGLVLNSISNMQQSRGSGWWLAQGGEPQWLAECEKQALATAIVGHIMQQMERR
ncbi:MAG: bifunctional phosphopantothenoylcysteine decarboxylase/phosphopantothenate--cysteine ligase CoaBC [Mariprofundales bacterium]